MTPVSYSELCGDLASYLDQVCDNRAPLLVTRRNARNVILISEEDYEGLIETIHLLKSPANAECLLQSISRADQSQLIQRDVNNNGYGVK